MRTSWLPAVLAGLCVAVAGAARAEDDLRAVIEKAVQAAGGADRLSGARAVTTRIKGTHHLSGSASFSGELISDGSTRYKHIFDLDQGGAIHSMVYVRNGEQSWRSINGETHEVDLETKTVLKKAGYVDRVATLLPLLKDKDGEFKLSGLDAMDVEGRPARGIKVSAKDQPDVHLYFDRESGLLVKTEYRALDDRFGQEMTTTIVLADYRELNPVAADEEVLKNASVATDGPALVDFFRKRAATDAQKERVKVLIRQLADSSFQVREKATMELIEIGTAAVAALKVAVKDDDPEVAKRAEQCLEAIEARGGTKVAVAAARLVAWRKPAGAAAVLLQYLTGADPEVAREVLAALAAVATVDGKPDKVLLQALEDKDPVRKAAAMAALGRDGGVFEQQPGRRLLLSGVKHPMKVIGYRDGKKILEWEVTELHYFNKLDDSVFARPGNNP
jgi:hypothetical protein